jgi:hypothetical protein
MILIVVNTSPLAVGLVVRTARVFRTLRGFALTGLKNDIVLTFLFEHY